MSFANARLLQNTWIKTHGFVIQDAGAIQDTARVENETPTPQKTAVTEAEREASQIVRVGKGGGSAPAAAAPERVGPPASQWVAGAARGEAEALYLLGTCFYQGLGVPQSYERAAKLFQQAAAKGHAGAQYNLGCLHRDGQDLR